MQARSRGRGGRLVLIAAAAAAAAALGAGIWALAASEDAPLEAPRLTATLHDERRALPGGVLEWRTLWRLCWSAREGASGYELQERYGEGGAGRPRLSRGRCHSLEVASGRNPLRQGLLHRKVQIGLHAGQLGYRVRAVGDGGAAGAWSRTIAAGQPSP